MPAAYIAPPTSPLKSPTSYTFTSLVSRSQTVADLRPFHAEAPTVPSTLFLGLYRDEGDQYLAASQSPSDCIDDRAMTDPDLAHHLHETALARASSILSTLRASPHALDGLRKLVFRDPHYSDKSSSIAAEAVTSEIFSRLHYHQVESAGGIHDIVLEDVDFGELDTYYPQTALPLGLLIKGNSSLTSLRLSSCTIPWQLLSNLPSLMDLSLTSVSVLEGTYTPDILLPGIPFKTPLRRLAFQNSTDLIRKLVFGPQEGHCIAWRECVELEVDLGSEASRALSWVIVHECAARVQNLGVRWEGNSDDEGSYSSGSDDEDTFTLSNLHLPMLHTLTSTDMYDLASLTPLSCTAALLLSLIPSPSVLNPSSPAPNLTTLRLNLAGLPLSHPEAHSSPAGWLIQNVLYRALNNIDARLAALAPFHHRLGDVRLWCGWEAGVDLERLMAAHTMLLANHADSVKVMREIDARGASVYERVFFDPDSRARIGALERGDHCAALQGLEWANLVRSVRMWAELERGERDGMQGAMEEMGRVFAGVYLSRVGRSVRVRMGDVEDLRDD
ncbi:hypothetical protein DFP72DRAFT_1068888 [Ephemerocybe angulata]|uniref:Uncharacterized protein n=1 Tax=Ephemerocybe angulata TaxID=980116 RepID=A0A8H6HVN8_9AGAR|nr:hypothetical protein DFP72DRAFT_1068888 [Tulosesus angulatus]